MTNGGNEVVVVVVVVTTVVCVAGANENCPEVLLHATVWHPLTPSESGEDLCRAFGPSVGVASICLGSGRNGIW